MRRQPRAQHAVYVAAAQRDGKVVSLNHTFCRLQIGGGCARLASAGARSQGAPYNFFDLFYTGYATTGEVSVEMEDAIPGNKATLTCLIMHCNHTNAIAALPLPGSLDEACCGSVLLARTHGAFAAIRSRARIGAQCAQASGGSGTHRLASTRPMALQKK